MLSPFVKRVIVFFVVLGLIGAIVFVINLVKKNAIPELVEKVEKPLNINHKVIGSSVEGRAIDSYSYGNGTTHIMFVGGIHGGYEWNSVLLAYQLMDYLQENPEIIPANITVGIIPSANPDGVFKVINKEGRFGVSDVPTSSPKIAGTGRFNNNKVDLNRNFDCNWKPESKWRSEIVSAGTSAFSEPEAKAIRDFVSTFKPAAGIFLHSQSNAVYASECNKGVLPETENIMNAYAKAAGYSAVKSFDSYAITGDAEGWLASINIPAITVELSTHDTIEWTKNLAGFKALLNYYSSEK